MPTIRATTHFRLGRERIATMTEEQILDLWNEHLEARDDAMADYEHIAVEVTPGRPQIADAPPSESARATWMGIAQAARAVAIRAMASRRWRHG
jgi:hypothetical protein